MSRTTPYENVTPPQSIADLRADRPERHGVTYHEPAKWIARLRATASGGPFLLKTGVEAGHGGRSGRYDAWLRSPWFSRG